MDSLSLPIDSLYGEYADAYSAIAFDRDFDAENAEIFRLARSHDHSRQYNTALLELFAGPAWHACSWKRQYGGRAIAIDSSASMRDLAVQRGHVEADDYLIANLPAVPKWPTELRTEASFGVVLALRYSLGYLDPNDLTILLANLQSCIAPGGVLVLELHRSELLATDFATLGIRTRSASLVDGTTVTCSWPAGPVKWSPDRLVASMPVEISVERPNTSKKYMSLVSTEFMYGHAHVRQACESAGGGYILEDWTSEAEAVFPFSTLLALRRN